MESNSKLVSYLKTSGYIESERVEEAFRNVDRKRFVPRSHQENAYKDTPLSIAENATISAPHMVAISTELLDVEDKHTVLEIGSGSGYQAAILGELAERVIGVEIVGELAEKSNKVLHSKENVEIIHGDGFETVDERFDRVLFSAATDSIEAAKDYLKEGGVIVAPVRQNSHQILTRYSGEQVTEHGRVRFVDMV